jgi:hypothetical protein
VEAPVVASVSYRFIEEGGNGEEATLTIVSPDGFEAIAKQPYRFGGQLTHERVAFEFQSEPYPADWTGQLKGDVEFALDQAVVG